MFRRKLWIFGLLLMGLVLVPSAFATKPAEISGYFTVPDPNFPSAWCVYTGEGYNDPDGFLGGCVIEQSENPGLAQHGTLELIVGGKEGTCEYNLRTYDLDFIARFVTSGCTPELEGFHMKGVGSALTGLWEGSYHFDP